MINLRINIPSDEDIFTHYLGEEIELGRAYLSPLREESSPSFALFLAKNGRIKFKDFGLGVSGSAVDMVMYKYTLSYPQAMDRIKEDLLSRPVKIRPKYKLTTNPKYQFTVDSRLFSETDQSYWGQFGITKETLIKYDVIPCRRVLVYDHTNCLKSSYFDLPGEPMYAYRMGQGDYRYKIYRPYSNIKWLNNLKITDVQGWRQKPKSGETIIITSSMKDLMVFSEMNLPAISLSSEGSIVSERLIMHLGKLFKKIYLNLDSDRAGIQASMRVISELDSIKAGSTFSMMMTNDPLAKDISDYVKTYGFEKAKKLVFSKIS